MLKRTFGKDGFGQDFGGHLNELLRRTVEALLVAQLVLAGFLPRLHRVLLRCLAQVALTQFGCVRRIALTTVNPSLGWPTVRSAMSTSNTSDAILARACGSLAVTSTAKPCFSKLRMARRSGSA